MQTSLNMAFPVKKSALSKKIALDTKSIDQNESVSLSKNEKTELIEKCISYHESMVYDINFYFHIDSRIIEIVKKLSLIHI